MQAPRAMYNRDGDGGECKLFVPSGEKPGGNAFELPVKVALTFADGKIVTYRRG